MTTAAIYARVSTEQQSSDLQLTALREYVARRGWTAIDYIDDGVSGAKLHRPRLDAMLNDARKRKFDVVIVWKLDRFARSTQFLSAQLVEFNALGIDFVSLTESIDTTTPSGKLLFHIMSAIAEFERDLIRERVRAGLAEAKRKGVKLGRASTLDNDTRGRILQMRAEGVKIRTIAEQLGTVSRETVRRVINAR